MAEVCAPLPEANSNDIFRRWKNVEEKGFTLIELMVVILIVAILAAVAIPILRGRIQAAKWSEGAAIAGTIKTAAKVCYAEDSATAPSGLLFCICLTCIFVVRNIREIWG